MILQKWLVANRTILSVAVVLVLASSSVALYRTHTQHALPAVDTAATVTPSGSVLDFTAVGIELPLTSAVSNAVYAPYYTPSSDGAKVYGISTQTLEADGDANSACTASHGPLGRIRVTTTAPLQFVPPGGSAPMTPDNKTLFKIGSSYYQYVAPQEFGCSNSGDAAEASMQTAQTAVAQSFTSLKSTDASTPVTADGQTTN